ncbi:hypothetical protein AJ87_37625 [Rhizobium yanglingense]|nr:hypothetical protein AJ87_37625 [Rhizobium yanglingense]
MSVVFDLVVGNHRSMNFTTTSLSAFALLAFCLACTVYAIMSTSITLPEVLVVYFITVSAAFSGFYEITTDFFPWPKVHSDIEMSYVAFLYFLFLFMFLAGHLIANRRPSSPTKAVVIDTKFRFILQATVTLSVLCMLASADSLFNPRANADLGDGGSLTQVALIGKGICLTSFLFLLASWVNTRRHLHFLIFVGMLTAIWFNPIANPRFQFIGVIISIASLNAMLLLPTPFTKGAIFTALFFLNYFVFGPLKSLNEGVSSGASVLSAFGQSVSDYAFRWIST